MFPRDRSGPQLDHHHTLPSRAISTLGVLSVLATSGYLMRVLGGVGVEGNCGKLTFNRPELEWFLAHFVPLAVVMGVVSLLGNVVGAYLHTLMSSNKSKFATFSLLSSFF